MMLVVVRIGSLLPIPGVDTEYFSTLLSDITSGDMSYLNAFTGGSFEKMSLFALSITPYITSSIIMQLLTIAIPKLEEMQRDGEDGRKKIVAITRYVTIALALIQSTAMAVGFGRQGLLTDYNALNVIFSVAAIASVHSGDGTLNDERTRLELVDGRFCRCLSGTLRVVKVVV